MARVIGKVILLLILILILAGGGLLWFDYLNVVDAKTVLAPVYQLIGREGRTQPKAAEDADINLDAERLAMRLEALALQKAELGKQAEDNEKRRGEIEQMAAELEDRQKALDERENSFNAKLADADIKDKNVEQIARYLTGMPPEGAVGIIEKMSDQDVIDAFRKTEELAQAAGTTSLVSYWLSLLPPERAAELSRKMTGKPQSLN